MRHSIGLFWRTARFEILAGIAISAGFTFAALLLAGRMEAIIADACGAPPPCPSQAYLTEDWINLDVNLAGPLLFAASGLALVFGLLFGPALVGGELERGRLHLVWSLTGSRRRWLLWRAAPVAAFVVLLALGPAVAASALERVHAANLDPAQSFHDFGYRGPLLVVDALAVFGLGLAVGTAVGRALPALFITAGLAIALFGLAAAVRIDWLPREIVPREVVAETVPEEPLLFGEGFQLPDGRLLTYSESAPLRPPEAQQIDTPAYATWLGSSGWTRVAIGIRGGEVGAIELREGLATLVVALGALGVALVVVRRRRPFPAAGLDLRPLRAATLEGAAKRAPRWRRSPVWQSVRMAAKVGRPEVLAASGAALVVTAISAAMVVAFAQARIAGSCVTGDCLGPSGLWFNTLTDFESAWVYTPEATLPFVVGIVLGAPLVAREFEAGTGRFTWALSGSRSGWLLWRLAPVLLLVVGLMIPVALLGQAEWRQSILLDPWSTLPYYWLRGPTVIFRAVAAFGLALLAGVVTRRILPALIVSAFAALLLYNALDIAAELPLWAAPVAIPITTPELEQGSMGAGPGVAQIAPDGSVHLEADLRKANGFPARGDDEAFLAWLEANGYQDANLVVPGTAYWQVVGREGAVLLAGAAGAVVTTALILRRRRPKG